MTIPNDTLFVIQAHFHALIAERARQFGCNQPIELPNLSDVPRAGEDPAWFAVLGMYGGFSYRFTGDGADAKLTCESWSRVCGGSGQRHEITAAGTTLVEERFG
jgi:hypothetical protein